MRCEALHCTQNDGTGYCTAPDYVAIEQDGQCSSYYVPYSAEAEQLNDMEGDENNGRSDV